MRTSDGAHIRCLLATLFFRYMPDLIDRRPGLLGGAAAASHRTDQSPSKGMDKYVYTYSDDEYCSASWPS
jgi:DNA gyrase subunit B